MTTESDEARVIHVFNRMDPGGAELRTVELATATKRSFDFVGVSGQKGALDERLRREGHGVSNRKLSFLSLCSYWSLFRHGKYRAVHCHLGLASGLIVILAWGAGIQRRIVHFRSDGIGGHCGLLKRIYFWVSRWLIRKFATHIVGVSPGSLEHAWSEDWHRDPRCRVIPNGYDGAGMRRLVADVKVSAPRYPSGPLRIIHVGRPLPEKNRRRAIEIWAAVSERTSSELTLVGDMSPEEEILVQQAVQGLTPPSAVTTLGFVTDPLRSIAAGDVLVVTSLREGLPGVVLEALALGVPVVCSDLPGARWIKGYVDGLTLCSVREHNDVWVDAILEAVRTPSDGIRASFDRSPFQLEKVVPKFLELWGIGE